MKIVVVGCGKIGETIIKNLVNEGHDVVAVDMEQEVVSQVSNMYDVMAVCGNGADNDTLDEAGVKDAELFVAVTDSDERNMLSCFIASKMGAKQTIARIRNPEFNDNSLNFIREELGVSIALNPEKLAAHEIYSLLKLPAATKIETFSTRKFEIIEIKLKVDSPFNGLSLIDIRKKFPYKFLVCTVLRDDKAFIPDGNFVLKSGDRISITASRKEVQKLLKKIGIVQRPVKSVMILGASKISHYLAEMLLSDGNDVKIIDKDKEKCLVYDEKLKHPVMIHGDGAQQELLLEEGLKSMDAFVSITGNDECNILVSYFAQSLDVPTVITKTNRDEFSQMANRLGLDCIVSPHMTVANAIVRYARALENSMDSSIETLYKIMDGKAEALEFIIGHDCSFLNIPIKDIKLKDNVLIAGIIRNKSVIIPGGLDFILEKDKVVIVASGIKITSIADIIQ
ncbi:MAG: Trk system potassium transporter TrkA [Ruminococcaceae bacterium]|nr:Trk system potassium transporter TrkA [Oscillospiraceae bacterium]